MRRALITTTINIPRNLTAWRSHLTDEDHVIVIGDLNTAHYDVCEFLDTLPGHNEYLAPKDQTRFRVSETLGWNCIQRRNIAVLRAIELGVNSITTIDDDNYPVNNVWFDQLPDPAIIRGLSSVSGWWDPGTLCRPEVTHRGYPLSQRHMNAFYDTKVEHIDARIGVWASLWLGDPDIDAVERITLRPTVQNVAHSQILAPGTWAPFNSQATTIRRELAPLLFMWPGVGRYDDIWASYLARAVMDPLGWRVGYGFPLVRQDRNEHDLVTDLENELFGMRWTDVLVAHLRHMSEDVNTLRLQDRPFPITDDAVVTEIMAGITDTLKNSTFEWLPRQTLRAFDAWYKDLEMVCS
jgi:hypothetical protein